MNRLIVFALLCAFLLGGLALAHYPEPTDRQLQIATTSSTRPAPRPIRRWTWDQLADCESGSWDRYAHPIPGSRNWQSHTRHYEGGVHFAPTTWDANAPAGYPVAAYLASRAQQIVVAERVLARSGAGQWPTCSRKIGMR